MCACVPQRHDDNWNKLEYFGISRSRSYIVNNNKGSHLTQQYVCVFSFPSENLQKCVCVISEVTLALLDAANDKDVGVQEQVRKSILTLGNQKPDKVLSMCQDYLLKHSKVRQ